MFSFLFGNLGIRDGSFWASWDFVTVMTFLVVVVGGGGGAGAGREFLEARLCHLFNDLITPILLLPLLISV